MAYCPLWYKLTCLFHPLCNFIGKAKASLFIRELTGFFLHIDKLKSGWSAKERFHLDEVRNILDVLFILVVLSIVFFMLTIRKIELSKLARFNVFISASFIIFIPFFKLFWRSIFHPLFFNNLYWLNTPRDVSFYIMPRIFFKYSMIFFISLTLVINLTIWLLSRKKKDTLNERVGSQK
jgi:hypothetical protein